MLRRTFMMLSCVSLRTIVVAIGITLLLPSTVPVKASALNRNGETNNQDNNENTGDNDNSHSNRNLGANQVKNFNDLNNRAAAQPGQSENYRKDGVALGESQHQLKPFLSKQKHEPQLLGNRAVAVGGGGGDGAGFIGGGGGGAMGAKAREKTGAGVAPGGQFNDQEKQNIGLGPPPVGVGKAQALPLEGELQTLDERLNRDVGQRPWHFRPPPQGITQPPVADASNIRHGGAWQSRGFVPIPMPDADQVYKAPLQRAENDDRHPYNFVLPPAHKKKKKKKKRARVEWAHETDQQYLLTESSHLESRKRQVVDQKDSFLRMVDLPRPTSARPWGFAAGKPFHPTVAYTLFNASKLKNEQQGILGEQMELARQREQLNNGRYPREQYKARRMRKVRKPGVTAPPAKPSGDMKKHVSWFEGSRTYAFRASPDTRLLIRHAPIPAQGSPWPLPQHYYSEEAVFMLSAENFQFHAIGEMCDILDFQFERIRRNTFGDGSEKEEGDPNYMMDSKDKLYKEIRYINVTVLKECPKFPTLNIDESYDLEVKRSGASIIAREIWGAVRALETFSQLIYQDDEGRYLINRTLINDFPRFPHRGILLDTARHYLDKETIINNLEAMAQNKMNVFHWHIVDDQSFPFESKTYPNLTKNGAYDHRTHIYSHETIAEIIEEARLRGIRVIPEFDTPGHTLSWGFGQDYLLTPCYDYNRQPNGQFGPINPILKSTYLFLQKFFREVLAVFKEKYVHLGGDEVPFDCWESNPQINNFIKRNNLSDIRDVLGLYERKLLEIVSQLGKTRDVGSGYIVWQEVVDNGVNVKSDTIVHVWMGDAFDIERIINMGLRVIYSTCWYLDYISYGQDWDKYYRCEQLEQLQEFQLKNSSLFLGGEAALWMEYADDENVLSRLWPRASAAAERLWSNKRVRDEVAAASRIEEQRCRMLRRGLKVGVLSGPGYCPVWSRRGRPQQSKESPIFSWSSHTDELKFRANFPQVYVVDMNAMYLVPVLIVICICCLTLITLAQDSKSKIVAILSYPVGGTSKKGVKGLLYVFMAFAFAWCIWTAPIWMNSWETSANKARPVPPDSKHSGY